MFATGLPDIVAALGGDLIGDESAIAGTRIERIAAFESATPSAITFIANKRLQPLLAASAAGCVVVTPELAAEAARRGPAIVTPDPYLYYARLSRWWVVRTRALDQPGIHPSAIIDPTARVAATASVGALAVIEAEAEIGADVVIGSHCHIGRAARVGDGTWFAAHVSFGERCVIGQRGTVHGGVVVGAAGFGFAPVDGRWEKIEQLGAVRIGDDVDIGANTCIDRGALDDTVIGDGVKIDNLVQIAHNVRIGEHSAIAGCVGIAGSTVVGKHVLIGGAAMIGGHIEIADHVFLSGAAVVSHSVPKAGRYSSNFPLTEHALWQKNAAVVRNLSALRERVRTLEKSAPASAAPDNGEDRGPT